MYLGDTKSCGCSGFDDLSGMKFGKLTVIERDYETQKNRNSSRVFYKCKCDCGCITSVSRWGLLSKTKSCGCIYSIGEEKISKILIDNNILFTKQYSFDDLRTHKNHKLRFDFGILDSDYSLMYLIEYDGIQHFKYDNRYWNTKSHFENLKINDSKKNNYCIKNNINLIRIPYWHYKELKISDLIVKESAFLMKGS